MKQNLILFITFLFISFSPDVFAQETKEDRRMLEGMHSISSHELHQYVKELTSPRFAGRLTGTAGYDSAAHWLARHFKCWGIQPLGDDKDYFQYFTIPYTLVKEGGGVTLHLSQGEETLHKHYDYVTEYMPGSTSDSGKITAEVVYAGYGVTAPELDYNDYADVDVEGKIVLLEREVPLNARKNPEEFKKWEPYSHHQYKLKNAVKHGAVGMLYNYGPIANPNNAFAEGFIYSHIGDSAVQDIFTGTGRKHEKTVKRIWKRLKPQSFQTGKTVTIENNTEHFPNGKGSNVIGFIEGSDPELKEEVIIIGAHLDHVGHCHEMIPGANDNASGVAVMMSVARALKEYEAPLKRSVMFLAFGAEEQGIYGSKIYLENPVFPLEKTIALLNMDGVGVGNKLGAVAGENYPELLEPVLEVNDRYIHRHIRSSEYLNITRPRLDAARFMSEGIPFLSFYAYGIRSPYHVPADNLETITPEIMEDMGQLLYFSVIKLANQ
jgi:hypothetical protein